MNVPPNPGRLPTKEEAKQLGKQMHTRATMHPDGDESDHLIGNLLDAYAHSLLIPMEKGK